MDTPIIVELIKVMPSILRLLFIALIFILFFKPIKHELLPRLRGLKLLGFEATFLEEELNRVVLQQVGKLSVEDHTKVLKRAKLAAPILQGAKVLWVDDNQGYNIAEHRILTALGIFVDAAHSTQEAMDMLHKEDYHAVISDIIRNGDPNEGYSFVQKMREEKMLLPTIFYSSSQHKELRLPEGVFAITNRADHLVHYLIDIIERERC